MEGINWGARYSSFIEQALYFYDFDDITNLFRLTLVYFLIIS